MSQTGPSTSSSAADCCPALGGEVDVKVKKTEESAPGGGYLDRNEPSHMDGNLEESYQRLFMALIKKKLLGWLRYMFLFFTDYIKSRRVQ